MIGLTAVLERNHRDGHPRAERLGEAHRAVSSGLVTIEHQHDPIEVRGEQVALMPRQRRPHEAHDWISGLMDRDRVEESFDDDDGARLRGHRSMRACMHDIERHDHTLRAVLTAKLSRLREEVCVGSGQRPRRSVAPMRRRCMP